MSPSPATTRAESRRQAAAKQEEHERKQRAAAWVNSLGALNDLAVVEKHAHLSSPFPELEVDVMGRASRSFLATVNAHAHALAASSRSPPSSPAARERSAQRFELIRGIRAQWCATTCAHEDVYCKVRGVAEIIESDDAESSSSADRKAVEADVHVAKRARLAVSNPARPLAEVGGVPHFTAARWSDMISAAAGESPKPAEVETGHTHKAVPSEIDVLVVGLGPSGRSCGEVLEKSGRTRVSAVELDAEEHDGWRPPRTLAPADVAPEYTLGVIASSSAAAHEIVRNTTVMAWLLLQNGKDDDAMLSVLRATKLPVIAAASSRSDPTSYVTASVMGSSSCTANALRVFGSLVREAGATCLLADDMPSARFEMTMRDCASMCVSSLSRGGVPPADALRPFVAEIVEVGCGAGLLPPSEKDAAIADVLADVTPTLELELDVIASVVDLAHEHKVDIPRLEFAYSLLAA